MSAQRATGLGDPEPVGKGALFRPPEEPEEERKGEAPQEKPPSKKKSPKRVRTTLSLTRRALAIIQAMQNRHRLETGRALAMWRAVSEAIEFYGKDKGIESD